jgi:hypothetical protein
MVIKPGSVSFSEKKKQKDGKDKQTAIREAHAETEKKLQHDCGLAAA